MKNDVLLNTLDHIDVLSQDDEIVIIEAFMERYDVSYDEAIDIFDETKKWLWLASRTNHNDGFNLFIDRSLMVIDEMWHNFILHTKLYYKFCQNSFNQIIHHIPTTVREKVVFRESYDNDPREAEDKRREATLKQLNFIYDELGPETLVKWYDKMADKYTPEYLESIKKS